MRSIVLMILLGLAGTAQANTPVGRWHTIDDKTGEVKSMVTIEDRGGALSGRVTQILRKQYAAAMDRIEERVRGVFMDGRVECPALGAVAAHECQDWRAAARVFNSGSPQKRQMYRACRGCHQRYIANVDGPPAADPMKPLEGRQAPPPNQ